MAQSNLAREPSMDEILASIRKIIESNETTGPGLPANDQGPLADTFFASDRSYMDDETADDIPLTIDDNVFPNFEEEIVQPHRRSAEPAYAAAPVSVTPVHSAPLSLADVAARVRAASERQTAPRDVPQRSLGPLEAGQRSLEEAPKQEQSTRSVPEASVQSTTRPDGYGSATPAAAARPVNEAPVDAREPVSPQPVETSGHPRTAMVADEVQPDAVSPAPRHAVQSTEVASRSSEQHVPSVAKDAPAILSDVVSEQVARSFGELTLALDSTATRSFDEIAEEMLRPMLQEWLDDNLPTLVERLVREEIERVARGPRR
jgi:cell pole-organizing protein PopZ